MVRQQGIVLIILLVFLVLATTLSIGTMRSTILDQKMIANHYNHTVAFEAAESALLTAEQYVMETSLSQTKFASDCSNNLCLPNNNTPIWTQAGNWSKAFTVNELKDKLEIMKAPSYLVEYMPAQDNGSTKSLVIALEYEELPPAHNRYRITSRAQGKTLDSVVMLQSIVEK